MSRNKDLIKNTFYVFVGNLGAKVINFILLPLYTLWLSPADYGVVDLVNSYNNVLLMFVGLGVADALVVFPLGRTKEEINGYFSTALIFHLLGCLFFFFVFLIFDIFFDTSIIGSVSDYLWLMLGVLICNTTSRLFQYFCRGIKKMSVFSYTGILGSILTFGFGIWLIPRLGVRGFMLSSIFSGIGTMLFVIVYSKSYSYFSFSSFSPSKLKDMLKYSIPLIPNMIMWWLILSMNRPVMERAIGVAAVGLFGVAIKIPDIIQMVYNFFHEAWIVTAVEQYEQPDFKNYFNNVLQILTCLQTLVCLGVMMFGQLIFDLLINERFAEALQYVPILCISMLFSNLATFLSSIFNANKKTSYIFYSVIIVAAVAAILNLTLIPTIGIWGACIALLVAQASATVSRVYFVGKFVKIEKIYFHLLNIFVCVIGAFAFKIDSPIYRYGALISLIMVYVMINKSFLKKGILMIKNRTHLVKEQ